MGLKRAFKRIGKGVKRLVKNPLVQAIAPIALNMFLPGVGGLIGKAAFGAVAAKENGGNPLLGAGMGALGHFTNGGTMAKGAGALANGIAEGESRNPLQALRGAGRSGGALGSEDIENAMHGDADLTMGDRFKNFFTTPDGKVRWGRAIGAGAGALGLLAAGSKSGDDAAGAPALPPGWTDPAKNQEMMRPRNPVAPDYFTYGKQGGEHRFFGDPTFTDVVTTPSSAGGTGTGAQPAPYVPNERTLRDLLGGLPGGMADGGGVRGPGTGRSDSIEALLSDGEYVIDAESVALLGDGSVDAGAARLDQMRQNLRKHKGAALAKGKFSPAAKDPLRYMAEGGKVNPQLGVTELPPVNSNLPAPLPNPNGRTAQDISINEDMRPILENLAQKLRSSTGSQMTEREGELLQAHSSRAQQGRMELERLKGLLQKAPIHRAEGGPVYEMNELGDKLEAALKLGSIPEIDAAMSPIVKLAKGGSLRAAVEAMRAKVNKGLNPTPDPLEYLKMKHPQGSIVIDMLEGRRAAPIDTRRARTPEEQAAEQRILEGVELLKLLKGEKPQ